MDKLINAGLEHMKDRSGQEKERPGEHTDTSKQETTTTSGSGSGGSKDLFSSILGAVTENKSSLAHEGVDEKDIAKKHEKVYGSEDGDGDDKSLGSAAAVHALKLFSQGGGGTNREKQGMSAFIGMAMSEASKLFDEKNAKDKVSSGATKESTIQNAAETALKLYLKGQASSGNSGGGDSGGVNNLLNMASKFM